MASGPVIAISDTHIGRQKGSAIRLTRFLDWLNEGLHAGMLPVETTNGEKNLRVPEKLILLGDFLELWRPREADYTSPVRDGYRILDSLFHLGCHTIYVPGNHDDVAARYFGTYPDQNGHLKVVPKHYPQEGEGEPKEGERIGNLTYFFLHGHQFSRRWSPGVLKFVDFVGRVSYEAYEVSPRALQVGSIFFVLSLILALFYAILPPWAHLLGQLPALVTALLVVVWIILAVLGFAFFWRQLQLAWNRPRHEYVSGFTESPAFNRLIGKPKYRRIDDLVNRHYYKRGKDTINADVIVFGHTHVPGCSRTLAVAKGKTFVNTGSWVESDSRPHDTLAYIDEDRPQLLQWDDETRYVHEFEEN